MGARTAIVRHISHKSLDVGTAAALAVTLLHGSPALAAANLPLTPLPAAIQQGAGQLTIRAGDAIAVPAGDAGAASAAALLVEHAATAGAPQLTLAPAGSDAPIRFVRDAAVTGEEAYRLDVTDAGVTIAASGDSGFVYGAMTLLQLLGSGQTARLPAVSIADAPRFRWRGVMIDVARHFQPIEFLQQMIDRMVEVKLNIMHLHLTDDQGWRFPVSRYPQLTEIGAWRTAAPAGGPVPQERVGGVYTKQELKGLVAYAAKRGVTIVPEIDLPGHAQALVAAYPELGTTGDRPDVSYQWGINPWLFNPGPEGMTFVRHLLDELMEVFPSTFIHLGGDEAIKDQWERSPAVQQQMRELGITDENGLQGWMIAQLGAYLAEHGRRLIGWDEILESGTLPQSAAVMSWRGEDGAVTAANAGHDVVLSPDPALYLNNLQSGLPDEPPGRRAIQPLEAVWRYDPLPGGIAAERTGHVMGLQGNAWSEYLVTPWQVEHALFPRVGAVAEVAWSQPASRQDFATFLDRLVPQIHRWERDGAEVADGAFAVAFTPTQTRAEALDARRIGLTLATQTGHGTIRYTTDGTTPGPRSTIFREPLAVRPGTVVTAASFGDDGRALSDPRSYDTGRTALLTTGGAGLTTCPGGGGQSLRVPLNTEATANGPAFNVNIFDTCQADDHAPLAHATGVTVSVARLPRNWALAHETGAEVRHFPVTTHGELVISANCRAAAATMEAAPGEQRRWGRQPLPGATLLASFALPDPATTPQQFTFTAPLPTGLSLQDETDVCFQFTSPLADPFYAVEQVVWTEAAR